MPDKPGVDLPNAVTRQGPDFIGIGLQKAGTRWLYNQLAEHDDFWMPPIKELHFFDRPFPHRSTIAKATYRSGPEHTAFLRLIESMPRSRQTDFGAYAALFAFAGERLSGDITPAYSRLTESEIQGISTHFPQVKILLMLRDPISRLWSNVNDAAGRDRLPSAALTQASELAQVLRLDSVRGLSFPSQIYRNWRKFYPESQVQYFFLDDVIADPEATRASILRYLDADPQKKSGELSLSHNPKMGRPRASIEGEVKALLISEFEQELRDCAQIFGGPAKGWLSKYGLK